jgi:hypothetical protein
VREFAKEGVRRLIPNSSEQCFGVAEVRDHQLERERERERESGRNVLFNNTFSC